MTKVFFSNKRKVSLVTLVAFLLQVFYPLHTFALTGGPSQAEYENFEPAGATEMVNLATGDFVYNIPLMDIDGYPINISYHGGVNMEQEASWVGLGWSLNPGAINRGMRGFPDDFNGGNSDVINQTIKIENNKTWGLNVGGGAEVAGFDFASVGLSMGFGILYNNYKGLGLEAELGVSGTLSASTMGVGGSATGGLGLKISNQDGADFTMSGGIGVQVQASYGGIGVGGSLGVNRSKTNNSRRGIEADIVSGNATVGGSVQGIGYSTGTGSSINLIPNTAYTPNLEVPTFFNGKTGEVHVGGDLYWVTLHGYSRAYMFEQGIDGETFSRKAYGYMNLENADFSSLLDFNRDNDGPYYLECPKLPFANLTYDLFNANAQGLNELFRPYRNDLGYVYDNFVQSGGSANDTGVEGSYGNLAALGYNEYGVTTNSSSGPWLSANSAIGNGVRFKKEKQLANDVNSFDPFEHAYIKAIDEFPIEDQSYFNSILGKDLSSFKLSPSYGSNIAVLENTIKNQAGTQSTYTGQKKNQREARNTNFSFLNAEEASTFGLEKQIVSYNKNTFNYNSTDGDLIANTGNSSTIARTSLGPNHHISEVSVLKEDGARYIYGIPVYNKSQSEVVFNASTLSPNSQGLVTYDDADAGTTNSKGLDNFYMKKTIPAYAHSYLLTSLLSRDYVDITGNGLSQDDHGDYTKFNYTRTSSNYKWRTPCGDQFVSSGSPSANGGKAIYEPQWKCDANDDKGIYLYGEKELWYVHSIETKNYIAEFHLSSRYDARGVVNERGFTDDNSSNTSNQSQKLDKIVLYSKKDRTTPIKTVNFKYNYSLCPNTPNSIYNSTDNPNKGKLTLEKIYFTYGKSDKGIFSPYDFKYCDFNQDGTIDTGCNPDYNRTNMDRWGIYKVNSGAMDNQDFPYSTQNKSTADKNASAWSLSSVITPARSRINVYYEADDYSSIQNQTPGQMLTMVDFVKLKPLSYSLPSGSVFLYDQNTGYAARNYMVIDLSLLKDGGLLANSLSDAENILRTKMLPSNGKLFFKGFVQLGSGDGTKDYVPGYTTFDASNSGVISLNSSTVGTQTLYKYAYIKLNGMDIDDGDNTNGDCNPISKAAWQIARLYHPRIAYPGSEPGGSALSACSGLLSSLTEVFTFNEKNNRLRKKYYGSNIVPEKSFVRLNVPTKTKFGGGHRVSKIEIVDNWNSMVNNESSTTYGQTYDYTINENGLKISSGVASYEPLSGGDEISLRSPVEYSVNRVAAPNDAQYFENPIGEAFYPAATIIYGKITVKNLDRKDAGDNLITSNIGRTEYQFYTSKDFPIYSDYDALQSYVHTPDPTGDLFSNYLESSVHLSQGSILKLNNMHGKLKSVLTFQEGNNNPISGVKYYYKTTSNGELQNTIPVIDETGTISNQIIGQHVEAVADFRSQNTITFGNTSSGNLNTSLLTLGPLVLPIPIPSIYSGSSTETRDFYSATLNKVVTQQGILEKIETISNYATSTSENLVWDAKTNDVILSRTTTNFKDYDYSYGLPSHWVYKGMSGAYKNLGLHFKNAVNISTGEINQITGLLTPGDEVALEFTDNSNNLVATYNDRLWVKQDPFNGKFYLIDRLGNLCNNSGLTNTINVFNYASAPNYVLKVIRSGYRNILSEESESVTFSDDPRTPSNTISLTSNVIDASAVEYSEDWQKFCSSYSWPGCGLIEGREYCSTYNIGSNPYILNTKGNWNEKREYSYLGGRLAKNTTTNQMDIRKDGTFETYKPFFSYFAGSWKEVYNPSRTSDFDAGNPFNNWIMNSEITKISSFGNTLEAKDALNRFSASLYGYNHTMSTASASNAKYREIGFDNFEDYGYKNCSENHFNFKDFYPNLESTVAHTGRYSMKILPTGCMAVNKNVTYPDELTLFGKNNEQLGYTPPTNKSNPDCNLDFSPQSNISVAQKFLFSFWVKESQLNKDGDYTKLTADVLLNSISISTLVKKSPIINGWQKFDYEFTIPANSNPLPLRFLFQNTGNGNVFVDDVRVLPYNANMVTSVYDPYSLRLWAQLDDRNFATIYEYDNEGVLVRIKKETETGMKTIQETRNSFKKQ